MRDNITPWDRREIVLQNLSEIITLLAIPGAGAELRRLVEKRLNSDLYEAEDLAAKVFLNSRKIES